MAQVISLTKAKILDLIATHTHLSSKITDFLESVQDVVGAMIVSAGGTYDDTAGTIALPTVPAATTTTPGLVRLTNHLGGTSTAPTVRASSETQTGIVELATNAEAAAGTDTVRAVTPANMKPLLDSRPTAPVVKVIWTGTQAEYDAITPKVSTTLYFIKAP